MEQKKGEYYDFFLKILSSNTNNDCFCKNCGVQIKRPDLVNCAHILPKAIFKSISRDINNLMMLCFNCHSQYDSSWKKAKTMNCWRYALDMYNCFLKDKITEKHNILKNFE